MKLTFVTLDDEWMLFCGKCVHGGWGVQRCHEEEYADLSCHNLARVVNMTILWQHFMIMCFLDSLIGVGKLHVIFSRNHALSDHSPSLRIQRAFEKRGYWNNLSRYSPNIYSTPFINTRLGLIWQYSKISGCNGRG